MRRDNLSWGHRQVRRSLLGAIVLASLLGGGASQAQPNAISLPAPGNAPVVDSIDTPNYGIGPHTIGLGKCSNRLKVITCLLVLTRRGQGAVDYGVENLGNPKLVDNLHDEHRLVRAYFLNARMHPMPKVNLTSNDSIWIGLEFDGGAPDITAARIVFTRLNNAEVKGPVEQVRGDAGG